MKNDRRTLEISIESIFAFIVALSPVLTYYDVLLIRKNLLTVSIFVFGVLWFLKKSLSIKSRKRLYDFEKICIFFITYIIGIGIIRFNIGMEYIESERIYYFIQYFGTLVICLVIFKDRKTREYCVYFIERISMCMSICIILQYVVRYVLRLNINPSLTVYLPLQDLMDSNMRLYINSTRNLLNSVFFRPSAFFIEPAHFGKYCVFAVIACLYNRKKRMAFFISIAIILSTSGIGIVTTTLVWFVHIFMIEKKISSERLIKIIMVILAFMSGSVIAYCYIPFFRNTIIRLIGTYEGYNAIRGRLWSWEFVKKLEGYSRLIGVGYRNFEKTYGAGGLVSHIYMTSLTELFYCQGYLGGMIFLALFLKSAIKGWLRAKTYYVLVIMIILVGVIGQSVFTVNDTVVYIPFLYAFII